MRGRITKSVSCSSRYGEDLKLFGRCRVLALESSPPFRIGLALNSVRTLLNVRPHEKLRDAAEDAKDAVKEAKDAVKDAVK